MVETITAKQFCIRHKISMSADWADENPNMSDMPAGSSHWKCVFKRAGKQLTTFFSMGPAHSREPEAEEVLDCLASDSASVDVTRDFEDWARDFGYDTDSRKAEKTYNACVKQRDKLKAFLGDELYDQFLYHTERL